MIRSFLALFLTLLCACLPRTTQSPTPGTDETPRETTQNDPPHSDDAPSDQWGRNDAPAPSDQWGRYAAPPPGVEPLAKHDAPRYEAPRDAAPRHDAPSDDRARTWDPPAPTSRPSFNADKVEAESRADAGPAHGIGSAQPAPRTGSAVAEKSRKSSADDARSGLGTSWGETRYSSVDEVPFYRDSSSPAYTATMHYNDAQGAYALAGGVNWTSSARVGLGSALTMALRDEYGNELSAYRGNSRTVAVGQNGQRYTIVIRNNTNERFEVVLSVDGLDVLDGREAAYGKRGYLIDPYGTLEVEGFRQSSDAVASFRFGSVSDSYAARTGSARNVGVIGAAAFGERGYAARLAAYRDRVASWNHYNNDANYRRNADPFPGRYAPPPPSYNIAR